MGQLFGGGHRLMSMRRFDLMGSSSMCSARASDGPGQDRRAGRLLFTLLEPRLLLNADLLAVDLAALPAVHQAHDIVLRMVEETARVGAQDQKIQQVEVLDHAQGDARLALGDLSVIKQVTVTGSPGDDRVTIDAASFGTGPLPAVSFDGGGGHDTLAIDDSATAPSAWTVTGPDSGRVTGSFGTASFSGVQSIIGGGHDTLTSNGASDGGTVAGPTGVIGGIAFAGFASAAGPNQPVLLATSLPAPAAAPAPGIVVTQSGADSIFGIGSSNQVVTLTDGGSGTLVLTASGIDEATGSFATNTQTFAIPSSSLTINLTGGGDTFTLVSLPSGFAAGFVVDASGSGDTLTINTGLATGGHDAILTADTIAIAANDVISTRSATGNSGAITFTGHDITVAAGAKLLADSTSGHKDGTVTLFAEDEGYRVIELPVFYSDKHGNITVTGATIQAGDIKIKSKVTDISLASEVPVEAKGFTGNLSSVLAQVPGNVISSFTGLDASVVLRGANSTIKLDGATLLASESVSVTATTKVETLVNAISTGLNGPLASVGLEAAVAYAQATSDVQTIITGNTVITAKNDVTIQATGTVTDKSTSRTSMNLNGKANVSGSSLALAIGRADLNAIARVDNDVIITATLGNVNLDAIGSAKSATDASSVGYIDARAGISLGINVDHSVVNSLLNGRVTAGGTALGSSGATFDSGDSSQVNLTDNTIHFDKPTGFVTGQQVIYKPVNVVGVVPGSGNTGVTTTGDAVGGLKDGSTYYVIVKDPSTIQLAKSPALQLDGSVTDAASTQTLAKSATTFFDIDSIDSTAKTIKLAGSGFKDGDTVTYKANGNTAIAGLSDNAAYTVVVVDDSHFSLKNQAGTLVAVSQGLAVGTHSFVDGANTQTITLARIDAAANTIVLKGHGFTNGQDVAYASIAADGQNNISGLTNATHYTVQFVSANAFRLIDPTTNQVVTLADPGGAATHAMTFVSQIFAFKPHDAVNNADGTITLTGHGLTTGEGLFYTVDPTRNPTRTVLVQNADGTTTTSTVTATDQEIGGLQDGTIYYAIVVDANHIRLVEDPADVKSAAPIDLTALGSGNKSTLNDGVLVSGVGVKATLAADDRNKAKPEVGGKFNPAKFKDVASKTDILQAGIFQNAKLTDSFATTGKAGAKDGSGNPVAETKNDGLSLAGGVVVNVVTHDVQARVGASATPAKRTVVSSGGDVTALATVTQLSQNIALSTEAKPDGSNGAGVALSLAVGVLNNKADAVIEANTLSNAAGTTTVQSTVTYPFLIPPADLVLGIPNDITTRGLSGVTDLLDGTLGVGTKLLNTWVVTQAKGKKDDAKAGDSIAITGSLAINIYINESHALIAGGAQINQDPALQTATQSVTLDAGTSMSLIDVAGIGKWSLNESPAGKFTYETKPGKSIFFGKDVIDLSGRSGSRALGGSLLFQDIYDDTVASIGAGASVHIGAQGTLKETANEYIFRLDLAQAGGAVDNGASLAFAGSGLAYVQRSNTYADALATGTAGINISGGGSYIGRATTDGVQIGIAGAIVTGDGGETGIGVSLIGNDIERNTAVALGADPSLGAGGAAPAALSTISLGATSLKATTGGVIVNLAVAGVVNSENGDVLAVKTKPDPNAKPPAATPAKAPAVKSVDSGLGLAGAGAVTVGVDKTLAYINATGTATVGTLELASQNDQVMVQIVGGIALSLNAGGKGGKSFAGAFGLNQITSTTESYINGITLDSTAPIVAGRDQISVTATRGGTLASFTAAVAADTTSSGKAFSGSLSINRLVDTTAALIDGATVTGRGNLVVTAKNTAQVVAIGGGVSFSSSSTAVGASIGYNQISAATHAGILGTARAASVSLPGDITILADNQNALRAIGVSGGISAGDEGVAGAFTIGINILANDPAVFSSDTAAPILAEITNATVTSTAGALSLTAKDESIIQSIAGALGISAGSNAFGVGFSWNQVVLTVRATVDRSTVNVAGAVTLDATSTQGSTVADGKISTAAVSGAVGDGIAVGAAVAINGVMNLIEAKVTGGSSVTAGSAVMVDAEDQASIRALTGAVAISLSSNGVGGAVGANYIANTVTAKIDSSTVASTGSDVTVMAHESAEIQGLTVGLAGGDVLAVGGSVTIGIITDTVLAEIGGTATVTAQGLVKVRAINDAVIGVVSGQVAVGGEVGVGASISNADIINRTTADISADATVTGRGGVKVDAETRQSVTNFAVGGAISGEASVSGSATVTVVDDITRAYVAAKTGTSPTAGVFGGQNGAGDVTIIADSTTELLGVAGALSFGGELGIGVGIDTGVISRNTLAYIGSGATVQAQGNVTVDAIASTPIVSVSVAGAGGGEVGIAGTAGVSVLTLTTLAYIDTNASVRARANVRVSSQDDTKETIVSGNVVGAGEVGVGVAAGISVIHKTTEAYIAAGLR